MAALDFPSSPTNGQQYTLNGITYYYDAVTTGWLTTYVASPIIDFTSANNWANTKLSNVVAGGPVNISWTANGGYTNATINISTSGVTATSYGGTTQVPSFVVDSYGRITFAGNNSFTGGSTIGDENSSASTFYPVFTTTTSGTMTSANVDTADLNYVPSTGTLSAKVFNSLSDITLKTNIEGFDGVVLLDNISPVSFTWKSDGMKSYGVIAQDLEKSFPDLVQTGEHGIKSVSYMPLIGILLDVVKKQQKEIDEIKKLLNRKK